MPLWTGTRTATPRPSSLTGLLFAGAIAAIGVWSALGRGRSMAGRSAASLLRVSLFVPIASFFWLTAWHNMYADPGQRLGWRCIALTLTMGGGLLAAIVAVRKNSIPVRPTLHGAAAGAAAGACAGVLVDAWCPLTDATHVAQGHVAPIVLLTIVGAIVGRSLLSIRARM